MELPCLAFHRCGLSTQLFSASEHKRIVAGGDIDMDEVLTGKVVCPTAQGHLLVRDPSTLSTFLWNPRDGDKIHLPPLRGMDDSLLMHSHCLLSDEPTAAGGCVVLLVEPGDACIWYVHLGSDEDGGSWVKHDYDIGEPVVLEYDDDGEPAVYNQNLICPIAACRGKFYFNSEATELGVLEFCPAGPVFSSIEIDNTIAADGSYGCEEDNLSGYVHLVESAGELYMVTLLRGGTATTEIFRGASVHRMYFAERRWRKVDGLGGRVFLLSWFYFGASCLGGSDHESLRQDCVYVLCGREKAMVVFDVKERTFETHKLDEVAPSDKEFWVLLPTN